jgi:hypothetical protein
MRAASSQWPTANRGLRAGVYFLREEGGKGMREQAARKIVVLR